MFIIPFRLLTSLIALALVLPFAASPTAAQPAWESASRGLEGAWLTSLRPTPGGALIGATRNAIVRFDRATNEWTETLYDRSAWAFTFGEDSTGALYASGGAGVRRSTDDGRTWRTWSTPGNGITLVPFGDRFVLMFAGTDRSTDGGRTWTTTPVPPPASVTHVGGGRLVGFTLDSVKESRDTGRTWSTIGRTTMQWPRVVVAIDSTTIIAGAPWGMLARSTDGGRTWSSDTLPAGAIAMAEDGDVLLASLSDEVSRESDGIYRSTDKGISWKRLTVGTPRLIAAGPGDEVWASIPPKVVRSTDAGASWAPAVDGLYHRSGTLYGGPGASFYAVVASHHFNADNGGRIVSELMRTDDDGLSWRRLHDSVARVVSIGRSPLIVISTVSFVRGARESLPWRTRLSTDGGETWRTMHEPAGFGFATNERGMIALSAQRQSDAVLILSTDGRATVDTVTAPGFLHPIALTSSGSIVGRSGNTVIRSDDTGRTWRTLLDSVSASHLMAFGDSVLLAVVRREASGRPSGVIRSNDGGVTWSLTSPVSDVLNVLRDSLATMLLWNGDGQPLSLLISASTDAGATWRHGEVPTAQHPSAISVDRGNVLYTYAGGSIHRSLDHGATWQTIAPPLRDAWYSAATNDRVMLAAADRIWRTAAPARVGLESGPDEAALGVVPVPARDVIRLELPCAGRVDIVDARGAVALTRDVAEAGGATIGIDGLADGIYLVRARCGGRSLVGRIVVRGR